MNWSKAYQSRPSVPADNSVLFVLAPRTVLMNEFTRSRSLHAQGRRQEPCYTPNHLAACSHVTFAFLPPSSFGQRFKAANSKTCSLGALRAMR
jgi:hypothetical protein